MIRTDGKPTIAWAQFGSDPRVRKITVRLTPDEFANVQTAVEHHLDYLADFGAKDYPEEDLPEIVASYQDALDALDDAGRRFFDR